MAPATVKRPDAPKTSRPGARHHDAAHVLELAGALPGGRRDEHHRDRRYRRVGCEIVRGLLARGDAVAALVRDPGKARRAFGEPGGMRIRRTRLDDPRDLTAALDGIRTIFIAMGSTGIEGVLQRIAISAAAGISSIQQVTRLSVLNALADSLLITREWAILAGENDYMTGTFGQITGRPPRPVAEFFHQYRAECT